MSDTKLNLRRSLSWSTDSGGFVPCIYLPSADRNFQYNISHGFGWDAIFDGSRNRGISGEPSLHGIHFASSPRYFRLDLPDGASTYKVYAVACDQAGTANVDWGFHDGSAATSFFDWSGTTLSGTDTLDIDGNSVSVTSWTESGNGYVEHTFTADHMIIKPLSSGVEISAVWVVGSAPAADFYNPFQSKSFNNDFQQRLK